MTDSGSSPRGRGKLNLETVTDESVGLIPARAGKTQHLSTQVACAWAHPRAGGENERDRIFDRGDNGSSPRGRGKLVRVQIPHGSFRLIPARAGKTDPRRRSHTMRRAHPRAGGENCLIGVIAAMFAGSSPRGRGKRTIRAAERDCPEAHPRAGGENFRPSTSDFQGCGSSPRGRGKPVESVGE